MLASLLRAFLSQSDFFRRSVLELYVFAKWSRFVELERSDDDALLPFRFLGEPPPSRSDSLVLDSPRPRDFDLFGAADLWNKNFSGLHRCLDSSALGLFSSVSVASEENEFESSGSAVLSILPNLAQICARKTLLLSQYVRLMNSTTGHSINGLHTICSQQRS